MGEYELDHKSFIGIFIDDEKQIDLMMKRFESQAQILHSLK